MQFFKKKPKKEENFNPGNFNQQGQPGQLGFQPQMGQGGFPNQQQGFPNYQNVNSNQPSQFDFNVNQQQQQQPPNQTMNSNGMMPQNTFPNNNQNNFQPISPSTFPNGNNNQNSTLFSFPEQYTNPSERDNRINEINLTFNENTTNQQVASSFNVEDPKNMQEAKSVIYELRERVHYLEATLGSLQTNYDSERLLAKKQNSEISTYKKELISIIQEVMQPEKYQYEKENGELELLTFKEICEFFKANIREILSTEKQKSAKLFSLLKDMEEKNKRLEGMQNFGGQTEASVSSITPNPSTDTFKNITNIDKINSILNKSDSNSPSPNFNPPPEILPVEKPSTTQVKNEKLEQLKDEIATFKESSEDVTLHKNEESILKAIAETGFDTIDALTKDLEHIRNGLNPGSFKTMLYNYKKKLVEKKLLDVQIVETPLKGYHKVELFKLSSKGIALYQKLYGKSPVASNMTKRLNQHSSYEHSYTIDKITESLLINKYEVITDAKELRFPVEVDGKNYHVEFDLIAKKNSEIYYIEVEMGTTDAIGFQDKCDKNYMFNKAKGSPVVIVSPSKKVAETNLQKVNNWMKSRGGFKTLHKEKKLKVLLPYFDEIKGNKWTNKLEFFIDLTEPEIEG